MTTVEPFSVSVVLDGAVTRVVATGDLDLDAAPDLRMALLEASEHGTPEVVVDLAEAGFLDSSALNCLLGSRAALMAESRALLVENIPPPIARVFEVAGVLELFQPPSPPLS